MARITVGRAFVLGRRRREAFVLEQQLGQQKMHARRARIRRKGIEIDAVPAHCFLIVLALLGLLRNGVVVARQFFEMRPHVRQHALVHRHAVHPLKLALDSVAHDEFLLRFERERGKTRLLISLNDPGLHERRLGVRWIAARERVECMGAVLDALLFEIQFTELLIYAKFVLAPRWRRETGRTAGGTHR